MSTNDVNLDGNNVSSSTAHKASQRPLRETVAEETDSDELYALAEHPDPEIRALVAGNIHADRQTLATLLQQPHDNSVNEALSKNPHTEDHLLWRISRTSENIKIIQNVCEHPNISLETATELFNRRKHRYASCVVFSRHASAFKDYFLASEDPEIRFAFASNPSVSHADVAELLNDEKQNIRWVATNIERH